MATTKKEAMARITEETEKEFYYSPTIAEERSGKKCFVNEVEYSFAVVRGTESGKKIVREYKKRYNDIELAYVGQIKNCSVEVEYYKSK